MSGASEEVIRKLEHAYSEATPEEAARLNRMLAAYFAGHPPGSELGPDEFDYRADFLNDPFNQTWFAKVMFGRMIRDVERMTNEEFYRTYITGELEVES